MTQKWKDAVKNALERYSKNNSVNVIKRADFLAQELDSIKQATQKSGGTPSQTVSRCLQELREEGFLYFSDNSGEYVMNQKQIIASAEDFPEDALENAVGRGLLVLDDVDTSDVTATKRIRKGVQALRKRTLANYYSCCALCDIDDTKLLITSHIVRWTDQIETRGLLSNTICFCTLHDKLFETGYFSINPQYDLIWASAIKSQAIQVWATQCTHSFRLPMQIGPSLSYLEQHRVRVGGFN